MARAINRRPGRAGLILLGILPFAVLVMVYLAASDARLAVNPSDKLLPSPESFAAAIDRLAFQPDPRKGIYTLWADTAASLLRLALGLAIATGIGLIAGVCIGLLPLVRAAFAPLVGALSMVPPLAILPILFVVFGLGEVAKVTLIVIGIAPFLVRDLSMSVMDLPREQLVKAQTLGASSWQIAIRVVLPQVLPRLVSALRLSLGPGLAVPHLRRGHRFDRRARLPHLSGPALPGDGCDPALRRLDHAAGLPARLSAAALLARRAFAWMPGEQKL